MATLLNKVPKKSKRKKDTQTLARIANCAYIHIMYYSLHFFTTTFLLWHSDIHNKTTIILKCKLHAFSSTETMTNSTLDQICRTSEL